MYTYPDKIEICILKIQAFFLDCIYLKIKLQNLNLKLNHTFDKVKLNIYIDHFTICLETYNY